MPRSDQFIYLANTANQHDFVSLVFKNYALNRADLPYGIKDVLLFRPVLYSFLGLEKWLFGLNFFYWQLTGLFLHLAVLWFLLKFLYSIHKSLLAFLFSLYFAVMFAGSEMVTWSHVNGYLIGIMCMLIALDKTRKFIKTKDINRKDLIWLSISLIFAVFIHEFGVIFSLFLGLYFFLTFKTKSGSFPIKETIYYFFPILLYLAFSTIDFHFRNLSLSSQPGLSLSAQDIMLACLNAVKTALWWLHSGLFPSRIFTEIGQRTFMYPLFIDFTGKPSLTSLTVVQTLTSIGLILAYLGIIITNASKPFIKRQWKFLLLLVCLFCSFALIISLGRVSARGLERILVENSYYHYFFWIFFIIFIYAAIPFDRMEINPNPILKALFTAFLVILIVFNWRFTFSLASKQSLKAGFHRQLNQDIQSLIKRHAEEEDFSFGISPMIDRSTYTILWAKRENDPENKSYNYFKLLYPEYFKETQPKYIYLLNDNNEWEWWKKNY